MTFLQSSAIYFDEPTSRYKCGKRLRFFILGQSALNLINTFFIQELFIFAPWH